MGKKKGPAWAFFYVKETGVICKYCRQIYKHANVNKMEKHVLKCFKCPEDLKKVIQHRNISKAQKNCSEDEIDGGYVTGKVSRLSTSTASISSGTTISTPAAPSSTDLPTTPAGTSRPLSQSQFTKRTTPQPPVLDSFVDHMSTLDNEKLNQALAKAVLITGSPLSMVSHPLWIQFFKQIRPSFTLPSRHRIATTYLDIEYEALQAEIKEELDNSKNLHLQCDGWSNLRNESIINFVITKPEPRFVDFIITKENRHDSEYLLKQMQTVKEKYGVEKFLVVIGDNAANMKAAFRSLREKFDHIVPLGCIAHLLHLLCNDILSCQSVKTFMAQVTDIVKTIKNSHHLQALFVKIGKEKNVNISLKLAGKTRWGSHLFSLQSLHSNKVVLQTLAVSDEVVVSQQLKSRLLDDSIFWVRVEKIINILKPIVDLITKFESNDPLIHIIHSEMNHLQTTLLELLPQSPLQKSEEKAVLNKIADRKDFALGKIHLAASLLSPSSQGCHLNSDEMIDVMEFICDITTKMGLQVAQVRSELADYRDKEDLWSKKFIWEGVNNVSPLIWWRGLRGTNLLADIAIRILSAPVTSAATERTFSTFSWIHCKKRNRLTTERAAKITYLSHNWKLLHKSDLKNVKDSHTETSITEVTNYPSPSTSTYPENVNLNQQREQQRQRNQGIKRKLCLENEEISEDDSYSDMSEDDIPYEESEDDDSAVEESDSDDEI